MPKSDQNQPMEQSLDIFKPIEESYELMSGETEPMEQGLDIFKPFTQRS